jgi:peptidoglycan hydrolase CwlO-like protein
MTSPERKKFTRPPATTVEGRENQLINDSYDLAEKQIRNGTASSQILTHFLKLGTEREKLEREKLRNENIVLQKKAQELESGGRLEELTNKALEAFRKYSGSVEMPDDY